MKGSMRERAALTAALVFSLVVMACGTPLFSGSGGAEKRVTISAIREDITVVLNRLAAEMGLNIVIGREVTGTVTAELKNVPALAALNLVIRTNGYDYRFIDSTIIVGTQQTLSKFPPGAMTDTGENVTKVLRLRYAEPKDIAPVLRQIFPQAQITEDARSKAVVVTSDRGTLKRIVKLIYGDSPPAGE
jgi:type II secretory pathway component GspD/PulD (secretin)